MDLESFAVVSTLVRSMDYIDQIRTGLADRRIGMIILPTATIQVRVHEERLLISQSQLNQWIGRERMP